MFNVRELLLHGFLVKLTNPRELMTMIPMGVKDAAEFCQVSTHTFRRWLSDKKPNPCAMRLLAIYTGYIPWPGWADFMYCHADKKIYHKDLKDGFSTDDLMALHWLRQEVDYLRREVAKQREKEKAYQEALEESTQASNVIPFPNQLKLLREIETALRALDTRSNEGKNYSFGERFKNWFNRRKSG